jgi:hypothetical protein
VANAIGLMMQNLSVRKLHKMAGARAAARTPRSLLVRVDLADREQR